jgi:alpha-L-fucosidase
MGMASNYQCFSDFKREEHKNTATTLCDVSYMGGCILLGVPQKMDGLFHGTYY